MTGLDRIKSKIMEDAVAKALQTEKEAEDEARSIMERAMHEMGLKEAEILKKAERDGEDAYKRMTAVAGLEGRKEILKVKQDMVDLAFRTAMEKLRTLPDREYQEFIESLAIKSAMDGEGEIILAERDISRVDGRFPENINRRLKDSGKKGKLSISEKTVKSAGGFILRYGDIEINCTFEILSGMIRPRLEQDVVKILFGA